MKREIAVQCTLYYGIMEDETPADAVKRLLKRLEDEEIGYQTYEVEEREV